MTLYVIHSAILSLQAFITHGAFFTCPNDHKEWKKRSEELQCPRGEDYHCGILISDVVNQFCFEPAGVVPNACPRFDISLKKALHTVQCKGDGCPTTHYITSNLYLFLKSIIFGSVDAEYPLCQEPRISENIQTRIDPRCYILDADNKDLSGTDTTLTSMSTLPYHPGIFQNRYIGNESSEINLINGTTSREIKLKEWTTTSKVGDLETEKEDTLKLLWTFGLAVPSGSFLLLLLTILSIVAICMFKRRIQRIQDRILSLTNDQDSKRPNARMDDSDEYSTIEEVEFSHYREDNQDAFVRTESGINTQEEN